MLHPLYIMLLLSTVFSTVDGSPRSKTVLVGIGAFCAISAAQSFIAALGFTATGIAVGSLAHKLQTFVAYINGGIVPPESFITMLQSIGTTGFALSTKLMLGMIGALIFIMINMKIGIF